MANVHLLIPSFNAGELSPLLRSRFAVEKVASGCRKMRNFIPHTHGPAFRRPGMEYMGSAVGNGSKSNLRSFNFSTTTGFILEFHPDGLQVWSNGLLVPLLNPVPLPYTEAECFEVQMAQVNDVCYLAHPSHRPRKLVRHADDDWRLEEIEWVYPALGDENIRDVELASSTSTELESFVTQKWEEFEIPAGANPNITYTNPDTTGAQKQVTLERWNPSGPKWVVVESRSWTTIPPVLDVVGVPAATHTYRLTYTGPIAATSEIEVSWTLPSADSFTLDTSVFLPAIQEPVTVPAGEWQTRVECGANVPNNAQLWVQRWTGSAWVDLKRLRLRDDETLVERGTALEVATDLRFVWRGPASVGGNNIRAMADGTAAFETLEFPPSDDVTLELDDETVGTGRTLTASEPIFRAGHVGSYWEISHQREIAQVEIVAAVTTIVAESTDPIRVLGRYDVYSYGSWAATLSLEKKLSDDSWGVIRTWKSNKDRNVISNGDEPKEVELRLSISAGTSEAVTGAAVPRFLLELADARINGIVKITAVGTLDANGLTDEATVDVIIPAHSTDPTPVWTEGAWSDVKGYPRTVALHGQRLWFGGTESEPMRMWGSAINDYHDFRRTTRDDASVSFIPAAQQSNALQWMTSFGNNLLLGTNGDEFTVSGEDEGPITPISVNIQRRSGYGSAYLPAKLLGDVAVFIQRGNRKIRQISPTTDGIVWSAADMTVLAEHVTQSGVVQTAVMSFPQSIMWAVTGDGKLLGMTYEQEQNVFGWHVHETDGLVESVAVVIGPVSDEVWLVVNRDGVRNVERLDPEVFARDFTEPERLIYLDAAIRLEFDTPTNELTGLDHLNGYQCDVLGDGAHLQSVTVIDGAALIEKECSTVIIGLPFTSTLQSMRLEVPMRDGTAQGRNWRVSRVGVDLHDSIGGEIADAATARFESLSVRKVSDPMDTKPPLLNEYVETAIESTARQGVDVVIRQTKPLPLNVGSIVLKGDIYGE